MQSYKSVLLINLLLLVGVSLSAQKQTDDFSGNWKTEEGATIVMSRKDGGFTGIGLSTKKVVVKDLQFVNGKWVSEITNPLKNITASGEFFLEGNKLKIVARKLFFSKTLYWTKLN